MSCSYFTKHHQRRRQLVFLGEDKTLVHLEEGGRCISPEMTQDREVHRLHESPCALLFLCLWAIVILCVLFECKCAIMFILLRFHLF